MLKPLDNLPEYSNDLWDYLVDMPYMPTRKDRDDLVELAKQNSSYEKRVKLWDYFFRIDPGDVGKSQKREIDLLKGKIEKAQYRIEEKRIELENDSSWIAKQIEQTKEDLEHEKRNVNELVIANLAKSNRRKSIVGFIFCMIGGFVLLVSACAASAISSEGGGGGLFACLIMFGLLPAIIGGGLIFQARKSQDGKIHQQVSAEIDRLEQEYGQQIKDYQRDINNNSRKVNELPDVESNEHFDSYMERVTHLELKISDLLGQIPTPPSNEEVEDWLQDDIKNLARVAVDRSGLRGRLVTLVDAENPFCIRGPAELQTKDLIPPPFRIKKTDRFKHLRARKYATMNDGLFVDFYGVYSFEFIILAENVLATYGTIFDFITGRPSGERSATQDYASIVAVQSYKTYREIETEDGDTLYMENVPWLKLSLTDADKIDITFPDEDYFKQTNATGFKSDRWKFDPSKAAESAIRYVREKVNEAQRRREIGN